MMKRLTICIAAAALLVAVGSTAEARGPYGGRNFSLYFGSGGYGFFGGYPAYGPAYAAPGYWGPYRYPSYRVVPRYGWYGKGYRGPRGPRHYGHRPPYCRRW